MPHLDLLRALPKTKRNIQKRAEAKDPAVIAIAKQYGEMYWDGPREYGYGGYRDDGRWHPVARDIIAQYGLKPGMRVLDVGCGKGFLVKALIAECPGLEAFGLDISLYALHALFPGSHRPHPSRHGGEIAVSRRLVRLRALAQYHPQLPAAAGSHCYA